MRYQQQKFKKKLLVGESSSDNIKNIITEDIMYPPDNG